MSHKTRVDQQSVRNNVLVVGVAEIKIDTVSYSSCTIGEVLEPRLYNQQGTTADMHVMT